MYEFGRYVTWLYIFVFFVKKLIKSIRNIGIVAHVDAGKTTLTENFLYLGGVIRQMGSVDEGSSVTDSLSIERARGISVRSAANTLNWNGHRINLIDTPGHTDFFGEVDRVLSVLDGAVILISAVEGLQSSVYLLWEALRMYQIPILVFINKIDRSGSDFARILEELKSELGANSYLINYPDNEGNSNCQLRNVDESSSWFDHNMEALAGIDDEFLTKFLDGETGEANEKEMLVDKYTQSMQLIPVYCGSAKMSLGVEALLNGISRNFPAASENIEDEISGRIFKIEHDNTLGRLAHVRLFSGQLSNRDSVYNQRLERIEKVAQIRKQSGKKYVDTGILNAGDVGILSGLSEAHPGDILGSKVLDHLHLSSQIPVLQVKVNPKNKEQVQLLAQALTQLSIEDPFLDFKWFKAEQEMQLKLMGGIQQEILVGVLKDRFGIDTDFEPPRVIYMETPLKAAQGTVEYTMPKPCWAVMKFEIEPLHSGSGIQYSSLVSVDKIHRKYQHEIEETITKALTQGIKGWEVTDIKVTLIDGEDHVMHSNPGDFILATPMGILRAVKNSGTQLLEPIYNFTLHFPEEYLGSVSSDINKLRGSFNPPEFSGVDVKLSGRMPVASSQDFPLRLNSLTSGRARLRLRFGGYQPCSDEQGESRDYRGVNPLDESLWILHNRGGYKADER